MRQCVHTFLGDVPPNNNPACPLFDPHSRRGPGSWLLKPREERWSEGEIAVHVGRQGGGCLLHLGFGNCRTRVVFLVEKVKVLQALVLGTTASSLSRSPSCVCVVCCPDQLKYWVLHLNPPPFTDQGPQRRECWPAF